MAINHANEDGVVCGFATARKNDVVYKLHGYWWFYVSLLNKLY